MARPMPSRMRTDREFRRKVMLQREAAEARNLIERWLSERQFVDGSRPPEISPPSGRTIQTWKKRKPAIKGGTVIGRRENYGVA